MMRTMFGVVALSVCAAFGMGCGSDAGDGGADQTAAVGSATGELTMSWSIDRTASMSACADMGVDALDIVIYDPTGATYTSASFPCEELSFTATLPDGVYSIDATLVDAEDDAVSDTKPLDGIDITGDGDLAVAVDFPGTSATPE